ncbi:MAG TPA: heavy metal translocating P-type ATPase metal-binding domain-containing protein [Opitutaceae bacterium]|nr:heavy metal translocating P-type ATPase metal-binding domain-containing protein [Opitutaceae bacterium]
MKPSAAGQKNPVKPVCRHCGAALLDPPAVASGFCCAGCAYVFRLVHEHGLEGYYRLKDEVTPPADAAVFEPRDYAWLEAAQREAEAAAVRAQPELTLQVQGISCIGCVWLIERLFQGQPGGREISVNAQLGRVRLRWTAGEFFAADFARKLQSFGYLLGPADAEGENSEGRDLVRRVGLCAAFALNVMLFTLPSYFGMSRSFAYAPLFSLLSLVFATLSLLVGGSYFLGRAGQSLRTGVLHIDLPIALGIVGAYGGSLYGWIAGAERFVYFDFVSVFILLMLTGRWAQVAAVERNRRRLLRQQPLTPRVRLFTATGKAQETSPEKLRAGQRFSLRSGQTMPVQTQLETPEAAFSLANINGEAEPRVFRAGQHVPAGAILVSRGEARGVAQQAWNESLLAQLLRAGERPGWRHRFLEKVVRGYLAGILVTAAAAGAIWWLKTGDAPHTWAVVTAVLVVSCPCAIGLAFPLADEMATVAVRRRGVFVRENDLWAKLSKVEKIIFDKTGTLTLETPALLNPEAIAALGPDARAALHALVRDNPHPVSQCLLGHLLAAGAPSPLAGAVRETVGHGVELDAWSLGRAGWRDRGPAGPDAVFAFDRVPVARFRLAEKARPDARRELAALAAGGYEIFILSGDRREKVEALARELNLPVGRVLGGQSPQAKADWLAGHDRGDTLMLGDGANDSLAFDRALCRGTPVIHRGLLEQKADFYYLGRGLAGLRALFRVNVIRRNTQAVILVFSVAYNLLAVGLAVAGRMNPLVAAILMPANSLLTLAIVSLGLRRAFVFTATAG